MPISDTSPEIEAMQAAIHRSMTGEQRLLLAFEMSHFARELAKQGIRDRHPEWPEELVMGESVRLAFLPKPIPDWLVNALRRDGYLPLE